MDEDVMAQPRSVAKEAEQATLGGMLLSVDAIADCLAIVSGRDFEDGRHEIVFDAIASIYGDGSPADVVTVAAALERAGELSKVGGIEYLYTLTTAAIAPTLAGHYAQVVADKGVMRRLSQAGMRIQAMGSASEGRPEDLLTAALAEIDGAATSVLATETSVGDALDDYVTLLDSEDDRFIPTPWNELNRLMGGYGPGTLNLIGARPSIGKSIVALNVARWMAEHGTVGFLSLEMKKREIMARLVAQMATIDLNTLKKGRVAMTKSDWQRFSEARIAIKAMPLSIDVRADASLATVQAYARSLHRRGNMQALFVDYLQLMTLGRKVETREREISEIARGLKQLAMDLDIPVIALVQVNRPPREQPRFRPRPKKDAGTSGQKWTPPKPEWEGPLVTDLRESGALEQHADTVLLLHRKGPGDFMHMNLGKDRNSDGGFFRLAWEGPFARATSMAAPIDAVQLDGMGEPR